MLYGLEGFVLHEKKSVSWQSAYTQWKDDRHKLPNVLVIEYKMRLRSPGHKCDMITSRTRYIRGVYDVWSEV